MEHFLIWIVSFFIAAYVTGHDEGERILSRRLRQVSKNRGLLDLREHINHATALKLFFTPSNKFNLEEEKQDTIIIKVYKNTIQVVEDYKEELRSNLHKAGIRSNKSLDQTFKTSIIVGVLLGIVVFMQIQDQIPSLFDLPFAWGFIPALSLIMGFYLSTTIIRRFIADTANKRKDAIESGIPDLLDLMVICSEAGFDVQRILKRTADEIGVSNQVLADELRRTNAEFALSSDFYTILKNFEKRTESVKVQSICNIILQSIEMGSSLTDSLKTLAHDIREERTLKAEEQAGKVPNKITMPLLIFIMPCLFIIILAPMLLKASSTFSAAG